MSAKKSKILGPGIWVQQNRESYGDKRGRVYCWDAESKKEKFLYTITKYQFMALLRHHEGHYMAVKISNNRWVDVTVVGDIDAFFAKDVWEDIRESENKSTPLY